MDDDPRSVDDLLAEDALAALAGRECEYGGGLIDPRTGQCEDESHAHCRFCSEPACSHELASWSDGNGYCGPAVPLPPRWLGPVAGWSDAWKQAAFGDPHLIAEKYSEL